MKSSIFSENDIITIVMAMIEDIDNKEKYGIESDELNIHININEKIENLSDKDCEELFYLIDKIAEKVYSIKNGELHELNLIHKEVIEFINENLSKFIEE
ncbi:hypothetical protein [Paraclostridium sordellii]|uniref:hypothetical protein n=1 Tax=Paraclostridium sordellii TaxID=1505 RepID=UPI0005DE4CA5|nr:hypothetical protein [Paeniclostridium sordellii]CEN21340.1 Uncharacterised protein [[Clostridium] sordellii] [Paeniclostridium sordellii]CEP88416.1 Uncharacterised protein [[Clostridium] sordellii] [Paeniclostridium sordellii]CEP96991.1 Uncharacterised protein [[Clostridium] sordellii] [Paeniclostridium sordellii]CEQ00679.1 Uncharacterised protein [[Clostridium] sordellii] [Paeniclostridium sordellii]